MSPRFLFAIVLVALAAAVQGQVAIPKLDDARSGPRRMAKMAYKAALDAFCAMTIDQAKVDEFLCMLKTISPANLKLHQDCFEKAGTKLPMDAKQQQEALCEKDETKAGQTKNAFICVKQGASSAGVDLQSEKNAYKAACEKS